MKFIADYTGYGDAPNGCRYEKIRVRETKYIIDADKERYDLEHRLWLLDGQDHEVIKHNFMFEFVRYQEEGHLVIEIDTLDELIKFTRMCNEVSIIAPDVEGNPYRIVIPDY